MGSIFLKQVLYELIVIELDNSSTTTTTTAFVTKPENNKLISKMWQDPLDLLLVFDKTYKYCDMLTDLIHLDVNCSHLRHVRNVPDMTYF